MASPGCMVLLLTALSFITICRAGPLGPLPNVTSLDLGLKEVGCALGDVVYMPGDEFPGDSACERCTCTGGGVQCSKQRCEPRPGCKALHRPDHCCPTYQCECEQEGRVYGNGEKLVDPADPCRVCYCQGGEVVCRRIACFVRDDCTPRHVPGRCCPEYDNCPLRGVTTIPGLAPPISRISTYEDNNSSVVPPAIKEPIKQEITIKEITPVSEIPVITEVKIKEILPSPSIEVAEYSSSKSHLIPREATSEKTETGLKMEPLEVNSDQSSSASDSMPTDESKFSNDKTTAFKTNDLPPSKISLSTHSINNNIFSSNIPNAVATVGSPSLTQNIILTSKSPVIEEEDSSLFDHNPAFPPLPDDLSVPGNHEDEILTDQNMDGEHISVSHEIIGTSNAPFTSTEAAIIKETIMSTHGFLGNSLSTENLEDVPIKTSTDSQENSSNGKISKLRENVMSNLRSVMPTETFNIHSHAPIEIADGMISSSTTENIQHYEQSSGVTNSNLIDSLSTEVSSTNLPDDSGLDSTAKIVSPGQNSQEQTTSSIFKSNVATEVTSQTELSSLPIETSDQNPHDVSDKITKDKVSISTIDPIYPDIETTKFWPMNSEIIPLSKSNSDDGNQSFENVETTEFILTSFGSQESSTDAVETIKISAENEKNSAMIDPYSRRNNNALKDLINLVGDVASIGDHTEIPNTEHHTLSPSTISDSEELIPVNAGYKSKNNNWNLNSITEVPLKNKATVNKQKVVEIEDDESDSITDSPPPNDKVEPTTKRPIIDNVSDEKSENKTEKKDIEIITQSYVPTINRRPPKVVMKKSNEKSIADELTTEGASGSSEIATDEVTIVSEIDFNTTEASESSVDQATDTSSSEQ